MQKRHMEGYYCDSIEEARNLALSLVSENASASFGGSVTLAETGILDALRSREDITLYDRDTAKSPRPNAQRTLRYQPAKPKSSPFHRRQSP